MSSIASFYLFFAARLLFKKEVSFCFMGDIFVFDRRVRTLYDSHSLHPPMPVDKIKVRHIPVMPTIPN